MPILDIMIGTVIHCRKIKLGRHVRCLTICGPLVSGPARNSFDIEEPLLRNEGVVKCHCLSGVTSECTATRLIVVVGCCEGCGGMRRCCYGQRWSWSQCRQLLRSRR